MSALTQYWAFYELNFHSLTHQIHEQLSALIPDRYTKETNTHLTIHPQFQFQENNEEKFEHLLYKYFPQQATIKIKGFYFHPSEYKPRVVCLAAQAGFDFRKQQERFRREIERNGGKSVASPKPPHITLYKARDGGKDYKIIPSNTNQIHTRYEKLEQNLPIRVQDTELHFEQTAGPSR